MSIHYDEKGKFFTEVISKDVVAAIIQTQTCLIRGYVHVRPGERFKDELNVPEQFLAVTQAVVFDAGGNPAYRSEFVAVNRDHILWVIPEQDLLAADDLPEGSQT